MKLLGNAILVFVVVGSVVSASEDEEIEITSYDKNAEKERERANEDTDMFFKLVYEDVEKILAKEVLYLMSNNRLKKIGRIV